MIQKQKKKFLYLFSLGIAFLVTYISFQKDNSSRHSLEYVVDSLSARSVQADVPHQSTYYSDGDGSGDDGDGDGDGDDGGGSDELY